jgi:hypothetical protein
LKRAKKATCPNAAEGAPKAKPLTPSTLKPKLRKTKRCSVETAVGESGEAEVENAPAVEADAEAEAENAADVLKKRKALKRGDESEPTPRLKTQLKTFRMPMRLNGTGSKRD